MTTHASSTHASRQPLDSARIIDQLRQLGFSRARVVDSTGSTNSDMVAENPPHLSVLLAEEQSAGKGRLGRRWESPSHSQIICTVVVELRGVKPQALGLVPLLTGTALAQALEDVDARVKWPNDLLVDGRKLAGILVEAIQIEPFPKVAIGFGINYDLASDELPVPHATSYQLCAGKRSREELTIAVLGQLIEAVERFLSLGGAVETVLPRYRQVSSTLGSSVRALLPSGDAVEGTAVDIATDGGLVITTVDGPVTVSAGDVEHLR